jgi:dihydrofolate reductase
LKLTLVAAVARGGVIGRDGTIPWRIPEDARRFREVTIGQPVVMGRRTWESLPGRFRPLPGRRNVVVTRNPDWHQESAERAGSLEEALRLVEDADRVSVIGGAELYKEALPRVDELLLTEIDLDVEGDTFFPDWDRAEFDELSREEHVSEDGVPFAFVTYARRGQPRPRA